MRIVVAEGVAELAPGHELVEKRLAGGGELPPALALAGDLRLHELRGIPLGVAPHRIGDLVRGDVAEVEVRRELARGIAVEVSAIGGVASELVGDERLQRGGRGDRTAAIRHRCDRVIDRDARELGRRVPAQLRQLAIAERGVTYLSY